MHKEHETKGNVFIGSGVTFNGEIIAPLNAVISGTVDGKVKAKKISVLPKAIVKGESTADEIEVKGQIHNKVVCNGKLIISKTGSAEGDVTYDEVIVERGGKLSGQISCSLTNSNN